MSSPSAPSQPAIKLPTKATVPVVVPPVPIGVVILRALHSISVAVDTFDQSQLTTAVKAINVIRKSLKQTLNLAALIQVIQAIQHAHPDAAFAVDALTALKDLGTTDADVRNAFAAAANGGKLVESAKPETTSAVPMDVDSAAAPAETSTSPAVPAAPWSVAAADISGISARFEVSLFCSLLIGIYLIDIGRFDLAAVELRRLTVLIGKFNRRQSDLIAAKVFFYESFAYERWSTVGQTEKVSRSLYKAHPNCQPHPAGARAYAETRAQLLANYRTVSLQHNEYAQAVLSVAILRNYLADHLYAAAKIFKNRSVFPDRSNSQSARYYYYVGRIHAAQLEYTEANSALQMALRKCPQHTTIAIDFRLILTKLSIIVQLLLGEIPDRTLFDSPKIFSKPMKPYLALTRAVRDGDLTRFAAVQQDYADVYERDELTSLISRLRADCIKAGLRQIVRAYSQISIQSIANALKFDNELDCESLVVKSIHEKLISASINSTTRTVISHETLDSYTAHSPQIAFDKRITFCLDINNAAKKAMRYVQNRKYALQPTDEDDDDDDDKAAVKKVTKVTGKDGKDSKDNKNNETKGKDNDKNTKK